MKKYPGLFMKIIYENNGGKCPPNKCSNMTLRADMSHVENEK